MWDTIKVTIVAVLGSLYSYLEPIYSPMQVLAYVFVTDIVAGILVDLIKNDDRLRLKKFLLSIAFLVLYMWVIATAYFIGERMGDMPEALLVVKSLTYVFLLFYVSNVLRNLKLLFPHNKPLAFLYHILGLQVLKRLPEIASYLGIDKNKNE